MQSQAPAEPSATDAAPTLLPQMVEVVVGQRATAETGLLELQLQETTKSTEQAGEASFTKAGMHTLGTFLAGFRLLQELLAASATQPCLSPQGSALAGRLGYIRVLPAALVAGVAAGTLVEVEEDTVADKRGRHQLKAAAAVAGRMMLAILQVLMLLLGIHPGTQRSWVLLQARLPRGSTRGAGLFILCLRPTA